MNLEFQFILVVKLLVAIFAGIIVGLERQWRHKITGVKTTALVSFGACMFVALSTFIGGGDPTRVAAQVVSGIGFLAGGVIIRDGFSVTGINTAATIWCSAAIGSFIGAGYPLEGTVAAIMLLILNISLRLFSKKIDRFRSGAIHYYMMVKCLAEKESSARTTILESLNQLGIDFNQITCGEETNGTVDILIDLEMIASESATKHRIKLLVERLLSKRYILQVHNLGSQLEQDPLE